MVIYKEEGRPIAINGMHFLLRHWCYLAHRSVGERAGGCYFYLNRSIAVLI